MTFTVEHRETFDKPSGLKTPMNVGQALREVLTRAAKHNRLVGGVMPCAQALNTRPDRVLLCVLPELSHAYSAVRIHQKLIEAFCREHGIKIVKVDNYEKLSSLVSSSCVPSPGEEDCTEPKGDRKCDEDPDVGCVLVQRSPGMLTKEEDFVIAYHDTFLFCDVAPPFIELPK